MLIEDEPLIAEVITEVIACYGGEQFAVARVADLAGGLRALARGETDLVLLDLNLPDSTGLATLEKVHATSADVPVIVLTGLSDESFATQALQLGAQDYLMKGEMDGPLLLKAMRYSLERKQFQDELKKSQAQMMHNEKMASIGQLAAGIAHEINNPIGFIASNLGSLKKYIARILEFVEILASREGQGDNALETLAQKRKELKIDFILEDVKSLIDDSLEGTERVKKIVQDLKSFSRADQDLVKYDSVNDILESTIGMVWNEIKYKATLHREFAEVPRTKCNPQQLSQVFVNLLMNAAQAIEERGEITVKTWADDASVFASVSDTGCGIAENVLPRLFDPFFTTKEVGKGTGLGLSIAYDIITKKHHGEIDVRSTPGMGSVFTVRIPIIEE
ncbi:sensor histidine kinase [Thiovibrio sp. JS02]